MSLVEQEKMVTLQKKMLLHQNVKGFTLTAEGKLKVQGKIELLLPNFIAVSPQGCFAGLNGTSFSAATFDGTKSIPLGLVTEKKLLLYCPDGSGYYLSPKNLPTGEEFFLVASITPEFCEFIYMDKNMPMSISLCISADLYMQVIGIAITLATAHDTKNGKELKNFFKIGGFVYE